MHLRKLQSVRPNHLNTSKRFALAACGITNLFQAVCASVREICIRRSFDSEHYQLRSADHGQLVVHLAKYVKGRRSFRHAGPSLWNALPQDIRGASLSLSQFQSNLKTFRYREVYHL